MVSWTSNAACGPDDLHLFFSEDLRELNQAKEICGWCPVRQECLDEELDKDCQTPSRYIFGIRGGQAKAERLRTLNAAPPRRPARCLKGHELTDETRTETKRGARVLIGCAVCDEIRRQEDPRPCNVGDAQRAKTECPQGHPYDEANTYFNPKGQRSCRACAQASHQRYRQQKKDTSE